MRETTLGHATPGQARPAEVTQCGDQFLASGDRQQECTAFSRPPGGRREETDCRNFQATPVLCTSQASEESG